MLIWSESRCRFYPRERIDSSKTWLIRPLECSIRCRICAGEGIIPAEIEPFLRRTDACLIRYLVSISSKKSVKTAGGQPSNHTLRGRIAAEFLPISVAP